MLTKINIYKLVHNYIGVEQGYLGRFSYRTHHDFYPKYCDILIDTSGPGTTKNKFEQILATQPPLIQAKIIRGVLEEYPVDSFPDLEREKKQQLHEYFSGLADQLEGSVTTPIVSPENSGEVFAKALTEAEVLLKSGGAASCVDRLHTALHGHILFILKEAGILVSGDTKLTDLFSKIRNEHPSWKAQKIQQAQIDKMLRGLANVIDALNPVRNQASMAHPNEILLDEPEAQLVVNASKTLFHYLQARSRIPGPNKKRIVIEDDEPF